MPVDSAVWQGISSALPAAGAATGATASAAAAGKSASLVAGIWKVATLATLIAASVGGVIWLQQEDEPKVAQELETVNQEEATSTPVEPREPETPEVEAAQTETKGSNDQEPERPEGDGELEKIAEPYKKPEPCLEPTPEEQAAAEAAIRQMAEENYSVGGSNGEVDQSSHEGPGEEPDNLQEEREPQTQELEEVAISPVWLPNEPFVVRFDSGIDNAVSYNWWFGEREGRSNSEEAQPVHEFNGPGYYEVFVSVRTAEGQEFSDQITLEVLGSPSLTLPNIFTPNGDGLNDLLTVADGAQDLKVLRVMIYDTEGTLVFDAENDEAAWDGYLPDGSPAPEGNYRLVVLAEDITRKAYNESSLVRLQR